MIHQYKLNGFNIVLDTCSGAVHVVDEVAYDIIALYQDKSADEITGTPESVMGVNMLVLQILMKEVCLRSQVRRERLSSLA